MKLLETGMGRVRTVAFSPDGQTLALGGIDREIQLWDWIAGECIQSCEIGPPGSGSARALAFSPDGSTVSARFTNACVYVFDSSTGQIIFDDRLSEENDCGLIFPNGTNRPTIAEPTVGIGHPVHLRQIQTNCRYAHLEFPDWPKEVVYASQSNQIAIFGADRFALYDHPIPPKIFLRQQLPEEAPLNFVQRAFQYIGLKILPPQEESAPKPKLIAASMMGEYSFPRDCATTITPNGRSVIFGTNRGMVTIFDLESRAERNHYRWPIDVVYSLAISSDGLLAVAGGSKGRVVVWDLED
jgi:WD40 repeat protein